MAVDGDRTDPHEAEQAMIREARGLKAARRSLRKIGERLEAYGLPPRGGVRGHAETGKPLMLATSL
jgi:hypothetical protein